MRGLGHGVIVVALTVLTQVGGLAWLVALCVRRRLMGFLVAYVALWMGAVLAAPAVSGRVPMPCLGEPLRAQSPLYCATLRHFVTPELRAVAQDAADAVADAHPGTVTLALDGGFPFWDGFPLLPHLSHDDGQKLDLAFYYADAEGAYLPGRTASPIGYWAFALKGDPVCPPAWPTMRWGMGWLQPVWPDYRVDVARTHTLMRVLAADPRVAKIFVEPPLADAWGIAGPKVRFQGCRAARHDDHIHLQM
ncbi:MAG: hypothetical protein AAFY39_04860 [Pseudomonadota bacterium]